MEELKLECENIRRYLREHSLTNTWLVRELRKYGIDIGPGRLCDVLRLKNGGTRSERETIEIMKKILTRYEYGYEHLPDV